MHIFINKKYLTYDNNKVKCAIGKKGIGKKQKEGDQITPKGIFRVKKILYRKDKVKGLKSKIKKIPIKKGMGWCDDPLSKDYNKLIYYPFKYGSENLYKKNNIYDIILVLNFNMQPIKKAKGSAIFIHVAKNNFQPTEGCIAIKKIELKKLVNFIKDKTKIIIN